MRERAKGAIAIGPTTNLQGSYRFLPLKSGHIITRREWTVMPIPPEAIEKVEGMAGDGNMDVTFTYRNITYSTADLEMQRRWKRRRHPSILHRKIYPEPNQQKILPRSKSVVSKDLLTVMSCSARTKMLGDENIGVDEAPLLIDHTAEPESLVNHAAEAGGPAERTRSTTIATGRKYFWRLEDGKRMRNEHQFLANWEIGEVFTQFTLKRGLKELGDRAEKGVIKELFQFVEKDVLRPDSIEKLTKEKMWRAFRSIMLVKEKRDGTVKGRGCCDRSGQRGFIDEFDAISPIISTEALAISCTIDAHEEREVTTVDIPGAYLHYLVDSEGYVLIEGVGGPIGCR